MRKIFTYLLIATFLSTGVAFAAAQTNVRSSSAYTNAIPLGGNGELTQPPQFTLRVRYGNSDANMGSLASGTAVKWSTISDDGYTVSACIAATDAVAGVLVTTLLTQDSVTLGLDDNWGEMAVGGYALALIDITEATDGQVLCLTEQVTPALPYLGTQDLHSTKSWLSKDIGTLIKEPAADGLGVIWLNLN